MGCNIELIKKNAAKLGAGEGKDRLLFIHTRAFYRARSQVRNVGISYLVLLLPCPVASYDTKGYIKSHCNQECKGSEKWGTNSTCNLAADSQVLYRLLNPKSWHLDQGLKKLPPVTPTGCLGPSVQSHTTYIWWLPTPSRGRACSADEGTRHEGPWTQQSREGLQFSLRHRVGKDLALLHKPLKLSQGNVVTARWLPQRS